MKIAFYTSTGHTGVVDAPKSVPFPRPLLEVYWNAHKLQVEFSVDAPRRANYRELLEGPRCSSLLTTENAIQLLQLWHGTYVKKPTENDTQRCVGVATTKDSGSAVVPGLILAVPVNFQPDGHYEIVNQNTREEIRAILTKASAELVELLGTMRKLVDCTLPATERSNVPEISLLPEIDSGVHITAYRLAAGENGNDGAGGGTVSGGGSGSQEFAFSITDSEIVP